MLVNVRGIIIVSTKDPPEGADDDLHASLRVCEGSKRRDKKSGSCLAGRGRRPWQGPGRSGRLGAHARTCQRQGGLGATQPGPLRPSPPSQPQKATLKGANYEHKCHDAGKAGDHGRGRAGRAPARGHARGRDPPGPRSQGLSPPRRSQTAIPLPKQELTPKRAPSAIQQLTATAASAEAVLVTFFAIHCLHMYNSMATPCGGLVLGTSSRSMPTLFPPDMYPHTQFCGRLRVRFAACRMRGLMRSGNFWASCGTRPQRWAPPACSCRYGTACCRCWQTPARLYGRLLPLLSAALAPWPASRAAEQVMMLQDGID